MKTKQEIREAIIKLHGATQGLNEAMNVLHAKCVENLENLKNLKKMLALNNMLKDTDEEKNT